MYCTITLSTLATGGGMGPRGGEWIWAAAMEAATCRSTCSTEWTGSGSGMWGIPLLYKLVLGVVATRVLECSWLASHS
jgi:hypothetical protein